MAAYDYRCESDGVFELTLPLGTSRDEGALAGVQRGRRAGDLCSSLDLADLTLDKSGPGGMTPDTGPTGRPATSSAAADDRPDAGHAEALTERDPGASERAGHCDG